jgi:hypothetical protein
MKAIVATDPTAHAAGITLADVPEPAARQPGKTVIRVRD